MLIQRLHPSDNVIVALRPLTAGQHVRLADSEWMLSEDIPAKHKFAARDFAPGDLITMYGATAGRALCEIAAGRLLTQRNVAHATDATAGKLASATWTAPDVSRWRSQTFAGFRRADGRCGTANHWLVIPLVFCENRNIEVMREALVKGLGYDVTSPYTSFVSALAQARREGRDSAGITLAEAAAPTRVFPHVDGVKFLLHGLGCGGTRQDARALCGLLAGYIAHPNVAGATVLSLGCQNAEVRTLEEELARRGSAKPLHIFEQQKSASERDLLERALRATFTGIAEANELRREPCPLSALTLGLKCGGSDGFSGLSANPALGHCADLLAALGGSSVLCEFPELCGAEQWLCDRCQLPEQAARFLDLMRRYQAAAEGAGSGFDMNPSPGNIRDGLITDAMKSLGAAKKSGTAPVVDVLDYPEPVTRRGGVTLLCTPGNDVEATTALTGSGCNLIVFTTGLGTPTGNPICPVVKMSTNTELATRMGDLIDFDAGPIVRGESTIAATGEALLDHLIATASGRLTPSATRLGQDDFLPWKRGVSL